VFPEDERWREAKRMACASALGLNDPPTTKRRCPATVDWYVAAHAVAKGWTIVTEDRGPEWQRIQTISSSALLSSLRSQ
jgi:predicted nucleic acid-binding protein